MPRTDKRGGPETRARILDVANRLFIQRGYEDVTVAQVAQEAQVSSVTVFKYFPRKEDLFMDRAADAVDLLLNVVRDRPAGIDVATSLERTSSRLVKERHPLSGLAQNSTPFFRTVAESNALLSRARGIAAEAQVQLARALTGDPSFAGDADMFASFFIAGYSTVLVATARALLDGEAPAAVVAEHERILRVLFAGLRSGVA